jgi:hypothetical protein
MNIRKFAVSPTSRLHLRDATDELMYTDDGKEMAIVLFGPGSKEHAKAQVEQRNRTMDRLKKKGKADMSVAQLAQETAEFLADCTKSFENIEHSELSGRDLYIAVYTDQELGFINDQVARHIGDWANFSKPSTSN